MERTPSQIATDLMRSDDWEGAHQIIEIELDRCEDRGNSPEIWRLRIVRADLLRLRGRVEDALDYLTRLQFLYPPSTEDIFSLARLKMSCGYCMGHLGRFGPAHELLREAECLVNGEDDPELRCEIYQRQAMLFYLQRDYLSSDRIFRLILQTSEQLDGWYFKACALWGIGKNLMIQGHYLDAMPWLENALGLIESANARLLMATVWSEMAVCHLGLGEDARSLQLLEMALEENRKAGAVHNYLVVIANMGNVHLYRRDYVGAVARYLHALDLAREIKDPVSIEKWSANIRLAYARSLEPTN